MIVVRDIPINQRVFIRSFQFVPKLVGYFKIIGWI